MTVGLRAQGAAVRPETVRDVTVDGARAVTIAAGTTVRTDEVALAVRAGDDVVVTFAVAGRAELSVHREGAATGWCSVPGSGDLTRRADAGPFVLADREGLVVEEVQVLTRDRASVLAVGDSLTDAPLPADTFPRWTDALAARLPGTPVLNAAIAGNRVVVDGGYGPTLRQRFGRDVLAREGIGTLVVLAGTNDLARELSADRLVAELSALVRQARAKGLRVVLLTIPPASRRTPGAAAAREQVNAWIRASGDVVDADVVLRDPSDAERLRPGYDHGDGLHLSPAGHRTLGEAVAQVLSR